MSATAAHRVDAPSLAERLDAALPQTQCTRCGYADCRDYARAIADGAADINRCPPGGDDGIARLARIVGRAPKALDPDCGQEGPRALAVIDEAWCIGCTLCIRACPVDCIIGASKQMHTVIDAQCTGCELCVPACPVDCIAMVPVTSERSGWQAWSETQAERSRQRYDFHRLRIAREQRETDERLAAVAPALQDGTQPRAGSADTAGLQRKQAAIEAAMARAKAARPDRAPR